MNKEAIINWLKQQQPKLEGILLASAKEYYSNNSSKRVFAFDARKTGEEMWSLSRGGDLCYDRPTIGFNYALWYHPKRINTFLLYFVDLIYSSRHEQNIEIFDLGAGTGAVLWAVSLVAQGLKSIGLPCPRIRVINVDTSAFMIIYNYNYLWKNFIQEYPDAENISKQSDYRLNSWSDIDEANYTNIWLCASYLFDHSENIKTISEEFKVIVRKYMPRKVILLSALQKRAFVDTVSSTIQELDYDGTYNSVLTNQIFSGGLHNLFQFRNHISQLHNLGLSGTPQWNIDNLYGRVLVNKNPQLGLELTNLNLFIQPEKNRTKIRLTQQQADAAALNSRPTLVIGPAGCGKSVVLTQKIKNLIQSTKIGNDYNASLKILVTTFNKGLVRYLGDWIAQLLDEGRFRRLFGSNFNGRQQDHSFFTFSNSQKVNIYVMHFDILPTQIGKINWRHITNNGENFETFHLNKMNLAITTYTNVNKIDPKKFEKILNAEFLIDEYQRVIYGLECSNEKEYQNIERTGRGNNPQLRYSSLRRKIVWGIIKTYLQDLKNNGLESFIIRRHRFVKKLRSETFQNKFTHLFVDEFQDCTKADYEIFYQLLQNPNNLTIAGDIAQSINLGSALHIPRIEDPRMGNFTRKKLDGSFRLPFRVSECIKPLSELINRKFGEREGIQSDIINPYKGAPPGSRPVFVFAEDTNSASEKIKEIFFAYKNALKLDKVTIFERDNELNLSLFHCQIPTETEIILKAKGLEKNCVVWSTRINVDTHNEKEEFIYTILTRTVCLLIILVFPEIQQAYIDIINLLVDNRLIRWDEQSEASYQQIKNLNHITNNDDDEDTSEDSQNIDDDNILPIE